MNPQIGITSLLPLKPDAQLIGFLQAETSDLISDMLPDPWSSMTQSLLRLFVSSFTQNTNERTGVERLWIEPVPWCNLRHNFNNWTNQSSLTNISKVGDCRTNEKRNSVIGLCCISSSLDVSNISLHHNITKPIHHTQPPPNSLIHLTSLILPPI